MEIQQLKILIEKYATESISEQERLLLLQYMNDPAFSAAIAAILEESYLSGEYNGTEPPERAARFEQLMQERLRPVRHINRRRYWAAAASILVLLATGLYVWNANKPKVITTATHTQNDIQPGKNGAILTLADGSEVVLDSLKNGLVASQTGSQAVLTNGQLHYNVNGQTTGEIQYNTINTPKGRQFRLTLPDGTNVWLNAASSIRYPTLFPDKQRQVSITGEVYFEVAQNAGRPFKVTVNNKEEVDVLGTHFNVNAYENEQQISTTLLQGSVKVNQTASPAPVPVILKPGQQARLAQNKMTVISDVDTDKVMAWKNGAFNFDDLSLDEAMRLLERWYDIDVIYENGIPDIHFGGEIDRNVSLTELLKILGSTKLKFRIEENRKLVIIN